MYMCPHVVGTTQASVDEVLLKQTHLSDACKHFLRRLLSVNPAERISLDQIVEVCTQRYGVT